MPDKVWFASAEVTWYGFDGTLIRKVLENTLVDICSQGPSGKAGGLVVHASPQVALIYACHVQMSDLV